MNRDIKFRVRDMGTKRIIGYEQIEPRGEWWFTREKANGHGSTEPIRKGHREQFTGEKDKNGLEVYEGDILRIGFEPYDAEDEDGSEYTAYDSTQVSQVKFRDGAFCVSGEFDDYSSTTVGWLTADGMYDVEVIGNAYENPELLEAA